MSDLSALSDEQLKALYQQQSPLASMSDADLKAAYLKAANPDASLRGKLSLGVPFTDIRFNTGISIPPSLEAGIIGAGKTASRMIQGVRQPFDNGNLAKQVQGEEAAYKPLSEAHPIATTVGETAPYLVTGNPVTSAVLAATEYGSPEERALRGGLAYGGAKVGQGLARAFGPKSMAGAPTGAAGEFFDYAGQNKYGIPLSVGQATGNRSAQIAESVLSNLPFGGAVNKARDQTFQAFNRALSNTFGDNASKITPEVTGAALERSGKQIGDIMDRANAQLTPDLAQRLSQLSSDVADLGPEGAVLSQKIGQFIDRTTNGAGMTGQSLRKFDSSLGRIMGNATNGDARYAAGSLQEIVRDAASRSLSEADQQALKVARSQNFNVRQVADAIKNNPNQNAVSPAAMLQAVNRYQRNAKFGGGNDLADLAQWAKGVLPDQIPNSGTAQRMFWQRLLTNPAAAGTGLLGLGYGADKAGIDLPPSAMAAPAVPLLAARVLAGKPAGPATEALLARLGLLGGLGAGELAGLTR